MSTTPPDRSADVAKICAAHPESFPPGEQNDPARLKLLTEIMVPQINHDHPEDGGNWGVLTKTNQGNKIPCDIMVWKPGPNITIDVMTGTGPSWTVQGSAPPEWVWTPCGFPSPEPPKPTPPPHQGSTIPYDENKSIQFGMACNDAYEESDADMDPGMISVHSSRCSWDYYVGGLTWDASFKKHINDFRAVYGLPPL